MALNQPRKPTMLPPAHVESSDALDELHTSRKISIADIVGMLSERGIISKTAEQQALKRFEYYQGKEHPMMVVAKEEVARQDNGEILQMENLVEILAEHTSLEYYNIDPLKLEVAKLGDIVSANYAQRYNILPISMNDTMITVATCEPYDVSWVDQVAALSKREVRRVLANPLDIERFQVEFYNLSRSIKKMMGSGEESSKLSNFEQLVELSKMNRQIGDDDQNVIQVVDWIWQYAFEQRASDIHMEPRRETGVVRFRIDSELHQVYQVPKVVFNAMTNRIKLLARLDVVEKRRPQDGRIKTKSPQGKEIELRISTLPTAFGEKLVMRIFDPTVLVRTFAELGFAKEDLDKWNTMTARPHGILLVTGPTGSGKTTTLYSTLRKLATPNVNVCTLEDPIELVEPAFNQVQIQSNIDMTFAAGIRALMRQDPDIIMVGEIRDRETAEMAIQAALTGHLVVSSLHTNDAPSALIRLRDLGVPYYLINATLLGVMAQRLVRTLCPHCAKEGKLDDNEIKMWSRLIAPWKANHPEVVKVPVGCLECRRSGYMGRIGLYEIMTMTEEIRMLLAREASPEELRTQAIKDGMRPLRLAGAQKVVSTQTTIAEVMRVVETF